MPCRLPFTTDSILMLVEKLRREDIVMKVNISIAEDLPRRLDEAASESGTSRSGLLSEAVEQYLREKQEERQLQRMREAAREIDRIRMSAPPWDATAELLEWRDKH